MREEEIAKLRERLRSQPPNDCSVNDAEVNRQRAIVEDLKRTCDELRAENERLATSDEELTRIRRELV